MTGKIPHLPNAENCWILIKDQSREVKLWLINQLSASLMNSEPSKYLSTERTQQFINKFCGKWNGDDSPDEIISVIREHHSIKNPLNFEG